MVLGHTIEPFYIKPTAFVNTFAIRFYPYGFSKFVNVPIKNLANKETPIELLFGDKIANELEWKIIKATNTNERIEIIENFLLERLNKKMTIDALLATNGSASISTILKGDLSKRR